MDRRSEEDRERPLFAKVRQRARDLPGKKAGDVTEFKEADISDWRFTRNGKIVGGETRPLLKAMP
jgi:Uncharacterized protein conserved in bacteria (DUF2314)